MIVSERDKGKGLFFAEKIRNNQFRQGLERGGGES